MAKSKKGLSRESLLEGTGKTKKAMLEGVLRAHPAGLTFSQIQAILGVTRHFAEKWSVELEKEGKAVIVWRGAPVPGRAYHSFRIPATRVFPKIEGWEKRVDEYMKEKYKRAKARSNEPILRGAQLRSERKVPVNFFLESSLKDQLERIAEEQRRTMGAVLRDAVRKFLVEHEHQTALGVFVSAHQDVQRRMIRIEEETIKSLRMTQKLVERTYAEFYQRMGMDPEKAQWSAERKAREILEEAREEALKDLVDKDAKRVGRPIGSRMLLSIFIPMELHNALMRAAVKAGYASYEDYVTVLLEEALKLTGVKV